jgi:hypothetical protein
VSGEFPFSLGRYPLDLELVPTAAIQGISWFDYFKGEEIEGD